MGIIVVLSLRALTEASTKPRIQGPVPFTRDISIAADKEKLNLISHQDVGNYKVKAFSKEYYIHSYLFRIPDSWEQKHICRAGTFVKLY
jgi:hypothetical protein